jgi:hypothetical protein
MASKQTPPVVFKARGMTPDVRITVFDTVFHVHSHILKLHSHFFFTFFDSADKTRAQGSTGGTSSNGFKYEWVTKIVDNGADWQLASKGPNVSCQKVGVFERPWPVNKRENDTDLTILGRRPQLIHLPIQRRYS